ncbi:MAG: DUF1289 domain-containing protein [Burkholderiaceae bacterium]|nr:DUF1289 domain-containing protein [Burkholderiaceae bacterium]
MSRASRAGVVPSPCISVCRIDPSNGLCEGCLRTLDEIACWGAMNDDARRSVWVAIDERRERRSARADAPASSGELRR